MHRLKVLLSRNFGSAALALVVTASLVLLMQHLIRGDGPVAEEATSRGELIWLRQLEDEEVENDDNYLPDKVEPPVPPPETIIEQVADGSAGLPIENSALKLGPFDPQVGLGIPDGDVLPIAKVSPVYPQRARSRGVEGYVIVEFTVDELGRVIDVRVVEAQPSSIFDRAAVDAVRRFKYKPRVINGEATAVTGVQHRLTFELT